MPKENQQDETNHIDDDSDSDDISKTLRVTSTPNQSDEIKLSDLENITIDSSNDHQQLSDLDNSSNNNTGGEVIGVDGIDPLGLVNKQNGTINVSVDSGDNEQQPNNGIYYEERIENLESKISSLQSEVIELKNLVAELVKTLGQPNSNFSKPKISPPNDHQLNEEKIIVGYSCNLSIDPMINGHERFININNNNNSVNNNNDSIYTDNTITIKKANPQLLAKPAATLNRHGAANSSNCCNVPLILSSSPANSNQNQGYSGTTVRTTTRKLNNHYTSSTSLQSEEARSNNSSVSPNPPSSPTFIRSSGCRPHNSHMSLSPSSSRPSINQLQQKAITNYPTIRKSSLASHSISNISTSSRLNKWSSLSDFNTTLPGNNQRMREIYLALEDGVIRMTLYNRVVTFNVPTALWKQGYSLEKVNGLPSSRLKLDWVHGYRGRDCRCNLYLLPTGEYVYFVGSIVVLYNVDDQIQRHYLGHSEDVTSLAVHPNKLIVASGQLGGIERREKRPLLRIWCSVSLTTLQVLGTNGDFETSIACLAFSKLDGGSVLAVVDESKEHNVSLWDWQQRTSAPSTDSYGLKSSNKLSEAFSGPEKVLAVDFHPMDRYSLISIGKSHIHFWDIEGCTMIKKAGLFDKYDRPKFVLNLAFNDFGDVITGDSNGNIIIWPRASNKPLKIIYNAHTGGVFTILPLKNGKFITGGGKDRRIVEWDQEFNRTGLEAELLEHCGGIRILSCGKSSNIVVGTMRNCILQGSLSQNFSIVVQGHCEAVTCLAIHPTQDQYISGGYDQQIHLFDSMSHSVVWSKCVAMPVISASFSPDGNLLIVTSELGKWCVIDALTHETIFTCNTEGNQRLTCVKFSPSGELFCFGSSDGRIYVYELSKEGSKFSRLGVCSGHCSPIKEIDWSKDGIYIQSQTIDMEVLHWNASLCRQVTNAAIIRELEWHTHNCTLGFQVFGIWPDTQSGGPINYCDRSNNEKHLVVANDAGYLSLYNWPASYQQCLHHNYCANSSSLNIVKFLPNANQLVAIASKDCLISEWSVESSTTSVTLNNSHNGSYRR